MAWLTIFNHTFFLENIALEKFANDKIAQCLKRMMINDDKTKLYFHDFECFNQHHYKSDSLKGILKRAESNDVLHDFSTTQQYY